VVYFDPRFMCCKEKVNSDKILNQSSKYEFYQIVLRLLTDVAKRRENFRSKWTTSGRCSRLLGLYPYDINWTGAVYS